VPVKNFENRSIFGNDMDKNLWLTFFGPPCICMPLSWTALDIAVDRLRVLWILSCFFSNRVINAWNSLPDCVNFSTLQVFNVSHKGWSQWVSEMLWISLWVSVRVFGPCGERIVKICQYLAKIWTRVSCLPFFDSRCRMIMQWLNFKCKVPYTCDGPDEWRANEYCRMLFLRFWHWTYFTSCICAQRIWYNKYINRYKDPSYHISKFLFVTESKQIKTKPVSILDAGSCLCRTYTICSLCKRPLSVHEGHLIIVDEHNSLACRIDHVNVTIKKLNVKRQNNNALLTRDIRESLECLVLKKIE